MVLRFFALVAVSAVLGAGIALIAAHFEGWPLARSAAIGLYVVAGGFVLLMMLDAGAGPASGRNSWALRCVPPRLSAGRNDSRRPALPHPVAALALAWRKWNL